MLVCVFSRIIPLVIICYFVSIYLYFVLTYLFFRISACSCFYFNMQLEEQNSVF